MLGIVPWLGLEESLTPLARDWLANEIEISGDFLVNEVEYSREA